MSAYVAITAIQTHKGAFFFPVTLNQAARGMTYAKTFFFY